MQDTGQFPACSRDNAAWRVQTYLGSPELKSEQVLLVARQFRFEGPSCKVDARSTGGRGVSIGSGSEVWEKRVWGEPRALGFWVGLYFGRGRC